MFRNLHEPLIFLLSATLFGVLPAAADPAAPVVHGIAMHGEPALPPDFAHFPYVSPDAPQGGTMVLGETGVFDSLNPFVLKGSAPWVMRSLVYETLLTRSYAEPFTLYASLASGVRVPPDRSGVTFVLDPAARFSDGSPVTVEDVLWSLQVLGEQGHPRYRAAWSQVAAVEESAPGEVTVTFNAPNRELPLLLGLRPILKKTAPWQDDLAGDPLVPPIGSGPYVVERAEPGRQVTFRRDPDWWGAVRPANRGLHNVEEVRVDFFRSGDALWQAVTAGEVDFFSDADPARWETGYDFPAIRDGRLTRSEIAHQRPTGMRGFVFNTRRAPLGDRRVRQALGLVFDWAWVNERLYRGAYSRIASYFGGSALAFDGAASVGERAVLAPFAETLPEGTLEGTARWPQTAGTGRDRRALRRAAALLDEAGLDVVGGLRRRPDGSPLTLGVLVRAAEEETLAGIWGEALKPLGIGLEIRRVDAAQWEERRRAYDYDITVNRWAMSLSPGTEQRLYFGAAGRETPGTRNYMGVADPAVEAAIDALLTAEGRQAFEDAARALDRVLTAGLYVVPFGVLPADRLVHDSAFRRAETGSLYGWWGWWSGPGTWWRADAETAE
ncbi:MAG: extracellular solute-binding protein [Pseudomonadota bacterium]